MFIFKLATKDTIYG